MKKIGLMLVLLAAAYVMTACTAATTPASNAANAAANTNSNANSAAVKPAASAPTTDALIAYDKAANEAYQKGDSKYFETFLADKYIHAGATSPDKAAAIAAIAKVKCEIKDFAITEPQSFKIDDDTYAVTYKATGEGQCNDGPNGAMKKIESPMRGTTVMVRSGDKWQAVFHGENKIIDTANPPKAEPKKAEAPKTEAKKEEASASKIAPSPNTAAVAAAEKAGWVMWMNKDAKGLDTFLAKNAAISNPDGTWISDRASIVKFWAEMPCKDVKNVDVKDPFGITLGPNTEMITFTGVADGTCYGTKNLPQPSMSIYVKEGDAWKFAFGFAAVAE